MQNKKTSKSAMPKQGKESSPKEMNSVRAERDTLLAQNRELMAQMDALRVEKDALAFAYLHMSTSFSWKVTAPMRGIAKAVKWLFRLPVLRLVKKLIKKIIHLRIFSPLLRLYHGIQNRQMLRSVGKPAPASPSAAPAPAIPMPAASPLEVYPAPNFFNTAAQTRPMDVSFRADDSVHRLNFVTDSLSPNSLFGGVATALILATLFCEKYGYELRIITRMSSPCPSGYQKMVELNNLPILPKVTYFSDSWNDHHEMLEVTPGDIFFATSWWSAEAIRKTTTNKRFFYIIQEVEQYFYAFGDDRLKCSQCLQRDNIDFIVNSHYLFDYFKQYEPNVARSDLWFEPAFSSALYRKPDFDRKGKRRLFFYARPQNPRNLFAWGVSLLELAIERGILDTDTYEICFAGQDFPPFRFCDGTMPTAMGQLSWEEYADFLHTVDLTVSLMYTPHPSYPPFDAACSGSVVLTNRYANKTDFPQCGNVLMFDLDEEAFLSALQDALELVGDKDRRRANYESMTIPRDWKATLEKTVEGMGKCIHVSPEL